MLGTDPDVDAREASAPDGREDCELRAILVSYERRPDRRTVCPREADEVERMTRWLTADDDAFRPLSECR